jgi:integrase
LALRWRDVDLARGTIAVRAGKTATAARTVYILPVLGDELRSYVAVAKRGGREAESAAREGGATTGAGR